MAQLVNIDLRPELQKLIDAIGSKNTYGGRPVSPSIMRQIAIELRPDGAGILAPYWLSVLQHGRGPRKSNKQGDFWKALYRYMEKHSMFRSSTARGKVNEAKGLAWYINKYGNQQFRNKAYIDIYEKARQQCIADVNKKYGELSITITKQIL
jgi:hypothetical protein